MAAVYPSDVCDDPEFVAARATAGCARPRSGRRRPLPPRGAEAGASYLLDGSGPTGRWRSGPIRKRSRFSSARWRSARRSLGLEHPDTATKLQQPRATSSGPARPSGRAAALRTWVGDQREGAGPRTSGYRRRASITSPTCFRTKATYAGARPLFERALAIREKAFGSGHPDTARSLNNLAYLLQAPGRLRCARNRFLSARLAVREKALGPGHPDVATSFTNLGYLLKVKGDLTGARPYYERALKIHEGARGPDHPLTATSLIHLAELLQAQDDLAGAQPLFERALTIRDEGARPGASRDQSGPRQSRKAAACSRRAYRSAGVVGSGARRA